MSSDDAVRAEALELRPRDPEPLAVDLLVVLAGPRRARVLDASGRPIEGATVNFTIVPSGGGAGGTFAGGAAQASATTDADGRMLTQREEPRFTQLQPSIVDGDLMLSAAGHADLHVPAPAAQARHGCDARLRAAQRVDRHATLQRGFMRVTIKRVGDTFERENPQ